MNCDHDWQQVGRVLADTYTTTVYRCSLCKAKRDHRKRWHGDDWTPVSERAEARGYNPRDYYDEPDPDDWGDAA